MGDFNSVTIREGKEVTSKVNPAGESFGKVVPLQNPSQTSVDRIQHRDSGSYHDTAKHTSVTLNDQGVEGLASARTEFDSPIADARDINPKSSIVFGGKKMLVSTAVQLGLLKIVGGQYAEVSQDELQAKADSQKAQANQNVKTIDFSDDTAHANIEAMNRAGNAQLTLSFAHSLIGNIVDGTPSNALVDTFSQRIGADPASVVESFEDMFNTQLDRAGEYVNMRYGIDADAFMDYISETAPKHIRKMAMIAGFHNDLNTLDQLVKHYKQGKSF